MQIDTSEAGETVRDVMADQMLGALHQRIRAHRSRPAADRVGSVTLSAGDLWLTPDQAERLSAWLENAILDEHESGWRNEPAPGRVRMAFLWSLLPDPLPGQSPNPTSDGTGSA
ncbi:MAG: hypothetical protein L0H24_07560 [Microlunatus sp.]|nr:hypothetical protein [Microlunatus sp.]